MPAITGSPSISRFQQSNALVAFILRKHPLLSITATTATTTTVIPAFDDIGNTGPGALVVIQFAVGTGGGWYSLGAATVTASATTSVFVPESFQEFVYLEQNDYAIAVMTATAGGIVNMFSVR